MNIYDQLFELHDSLLNDEAWLTVLETAMFDMDVEDIEELVERCIEEENEGIIYDLISEGELIISLKNQSLDEWYSNELDEENDDY